MTKAVNVAARYLGGKSGEEAACRLQCPRGNYKGREDGEGVEKGVDKGREQQNVQSVSKIKYID